ncbi:MAG: hypothetical protein HOE90_00245 [Bacteriovoracaceae bacterium]|jgi:hypothetical protein|nr:hypothetical protein [Bacteriovoracaceae bacterium]
MTTKLLTLALAFWSILILSSELRAQNPQQVNQIQMLNHPVVQEILDVYHQKPGLFKGIDKAFRYQNLNLPYRVDLVMSDLIDQLWEIADTQKLRETHTEILSLLDGKPLENFPLLFSMLGDSKRKLVKVLNERWIFPEYNVYGSAFPLQIRFLGKQKMSKIRRNKLISKYQRFGGDAESYHLLKFLAGKVDTPYPTRRMTVAKMKYLKKSQIKELKSEYYKIYLSDLKKMETQNTSVLLEKLVISYRPQRKTPHKIKMGDSESKEVRRAFVPLYNAIHMASFKQDFISFMAQELDSAKSYVSIPRKYNRYYLTPSFVVENVELVEDMVKEYTYRTLLLSSENDQIILKLRRWIKENQDLIDTELEHYNSENPGEQLGLEFNERGLPKRSEVIDQFGVLEKTMPHSPWMEDLKYEVIGKKGHPIALGKNRLGRFLFQVGFHAKQMLRIENVAGAALGAIISLSTGNVVAGAIVNILVKDSMETLLHNKNFKDVFKDTPSKLARALVIHSPWIPGHYFKIFSVGVVEGSLQGALTGQDIGVSAFVGGTSEVIESLLPRELINPIVKIDFDSSTTRQVTLNLLVDTAGNMAIRSARGATTAAITGESPIDGAKSGAIYGGFESVAMAVLFGLEVDPLDYFSRGELRESIVSENEFQNYYGAESYDMKLFQILDTQYRMEHGIFGLSQKVNGGRPFAGIGFISLASADLTILDIAHESAHAVGQMNEYGLFGFYATWGRQLALNGSYGWGGNTMENYRYFSFNDSWMDPTSSGYNPNTTQLRKFAPHNYLGLTLSNRKSE